MVQVGIIGAGRIGKVHLESIMTKVPGATVKTIAEAVSDPANDAKSLEIILGEGRSIEFDAEALAEKAAQAKGKDITISIEHADEVRTLTKAQKNSLGKRDAYDIHVSSGGKPISDMGGKIVVHVPYELKKDEKAEGLVVFYVDEDGQKERCESLYDSETKRVNFTTDHLSLYMIDYEPPEEPVVEPTVESSVPESTEAENTPSPTPQPVKEIKEVKKVGAWIWVLLILLLLLAALLLREVWKRYFG